MFRVPLGILFLCLAASAADGDAVALADQIPPPDVAHQLEEIFSKAAYMPKRLHFDWRDHGNSYSEVVPAADGKGTELAVYETESGKRIVTISESDLKARGAQNAIEIQEYTWSDDASKVLVFTNSQKVWRQYTRGDYWVFDPQRSDPATRLIKLGGDAPASSLMFASLSPDGTRVAYVHANNLYVEELSTQTVAQLTTDGSADIINGTSDWVNEEELNLRNCYRWSSDSRYIAYWQFDQSKVGEYTLIDDTDSRYPTSEKYKYPLAGTTNSAVRIGIVPVSGGSTSWLKLEGDPRDHYVAQMEWEPNTHSLVLEYFDRLQKTAQYILADAETAQTRLAFQDTDKAWVDVSPIKWIRTGKQAGQSASDLLIQSERDGWRHVYRVDRSSGRARLVTNFAGDVIEVLGIDEDRGWLYFTASPDDPLRKYLYRSRTDGTGTPERLTPQDQPGTHDFFLSPNGRWAWHFYSTADTPPNIDLIKLDSYQVVRAIEDNKELGTRVAPLLSSRTEFFKVKTKDNVTLDGWILKPPDFDAKKKYPVLFWVYGEPWFSTVSDSWMYDERLFHGLIASQGYLVITIDNAGTTSPRGREWRKSVYGNVGVLSSAQISEAMLATVAERPYIYSARMAIWGWSGGASNTLNLMFRYPDVFSTGIAVAPVPDQSAYDTIYQERYMGLPDQNKAGYHDGSPINFAAGLKGHLLLIHGSGDDNVHYQGSEELINKLIELNKPFDFMEYPNRTHAISEGRGTSLHLRMLIMRYLEEHVPPGGIAR